VSHERKRKKKGFRTFIEIGRRKKEPGSTWDGTAKRRNRKRSIERGGCSRSSEVPCQKDGGAALLTAFRKKRKTVSEEFEGGQNEKRNGSVPIVWFLEGGRGGKKGGVVGHFQRDGGAGFGFLRSGVGGTRAFSWGKKRKKDQGTLAIRCGKPGFRRRPGRAVLCCWKKKKSSSMPGPLKRRFVIILKQEKR